MVESKLSGRGLREMDVFVVHWVDKSRLVLCAADGDIRAERALLACQGTPAIMDCFSCGRGTAGRKRAYVAMVPPEGERSDSMSFVLCEYCAPTPASTLTRARVAWQGVPGFVMGLDAGGGIRR